MTARSSATAGSPSVGPSRRIRVPAGATIIDGTGKTVLPGFVFMHEHMFYPSGGGHFAPMLGSFPSLYLAGGVTTARTGGSIAPYSDLSLRDAIAAGTRGRPRPRRDRALYRGCRPRHHGAACLGHRPDAAERLVNYWADTGVTSYKAYMMLDRARLRRTIETAHRRGLKITGHLCAVTYREAAEMGIDNLEHGFAAMTDFVEGKQPDVCPLQQTGNLLANVDPDLPRVRELIAFLVARRVAITSTLVVFEDMTPGRPRLGEAERAVLNADALRAYDRDPRHHRRRPAGHCRARPSSGRRCGWSGCSSRRADCCSRARIRPAPAARSPASPASARSSCSSRRAFHFEQAVRVGTLNGARYLGREREIGSIEAGKRADLILVDGDPVRDPAALGRISTVFKAGIGYDRRPCWRPPGAHRISLSIPGAGEFRDGTRVALLLALLPSADPATASPCRAHRSLPCPERPRRSSSAVAGRASSATGFRSSCASAADSRNYPGRPGCGTSARRPATRIRFPAPGRL